MQVIFEKTDKSHELLNGASEFEREALYSIDSDL